jgi:hypothetical protein
MATLEIEGADSGWLATVELGRDGLPKLTAVATPVMERQLTQLVQRLLEEPLDGHQLGARRGEDLLHGLADAFGRRRPLFGNERLTGYVQGASRTTESGNRPPGWDEP